MSLCAAIHMSFTVYFFIMVWTHRSVCQPAKVALERDQFAVRESEHSRKICVVVTTGEIVATASLTISTHGLSATVEDDFVGVFEQELTFMPGNTRRCANFTVIEDNIVEGDEHLTIQIQSSMLIIGTPRTADITIMDTSRITIGLVSTVFTVTEGMQASVCAAIRNGTIAREVDFSIEALTVGTASYDPDEADYIPSTVSLAFDIHSNNQNVCGNFVIVDDNLPPTVAEDDEYFLVSLSTSDNADVSPEDATAKVVIHDNDGVTVTLVKSTLFVTEGETTLARICVLLVDVHDRLDRDVSFSLSIILLNSATVNDFGPLDTRTITFSSGSMVDDIECTDYLITDDEFKEGPENFAVLLSAADTVDTIVGNTSVFITIEDDMDVIQDCGPPTSIENGEVEYGLTLNGSVATYTCSEGYILMGPESITCLTDVTMISGSWSASPPVCKVINCGVPPTPGENGEVTYSVTTFGATATYSCASECYELDSTTDTLTCMPNESWSGDPPRCHSIECGQPQEIQGCQLSPVTSTTCGTKAFYSSLPGFTVNGDKNISCRNNGQWRGEFGFTLCQPSQCPSITDPKNGSVELSSLLVGSMANFSCDKGFILYPANVSQITCLPSGEWFPFPPTCEAITCPMLEGPGNGTIIPNNTQQQPYGTVLEISCTNGFYIEGNASRTCLNDGTWSGEETICVLVECELVTVENGNTAMNGTGIGSVVQYSCNLGYELVGNTQQVCLENGTWSIGQGRCELIDCNKPTMDNFTGNVTYNNTTYGNMAIFTCPGNCSQNTSVCNENGNWTKTSLDCFRCERLNSPDNGVVTVEGQFYPGSTAVYECDEGYVLSAELHMRQCTCKGWSSDDPICEKHADVGNNVIIIVVAAVGGSGVVMALIVCVILIWCCIVRVSPKAKDIRRWSKNNYKGNVSYVLPYTIYANRSSALEPLASNNRNSDLFEIPSSLESDHLPPFENDSGTTVIPSARGSQFGNLDTSEILMASVRGSNFGVKRPESACSSTLTSIPEYDAPGWAESSFSSSETSDQHFIDDSTSSVMTNSTISMSGCKNSSGTTDSQSQTKRPVSILKKK